MDIAQFLTEELFAEYFFRMVVGLPEADLVVLLQQPQQPTSPAFSPIAFYRFRDL
jgi:hypothetical protein